MSNHNPEVEEAVRAALQHGDLHVAATRAIAAYGPEILSFLAGRLRSTGDGEEAFSIFAEDFWQGLPAFEFRCTVRTWMYTVARNAGNRYASAPERRPARNQALSRVGSLSHLVDRVRSATQTNLATDTKSKVRALREHLDPEDQTLLILHIDRGFAWREIAIVMHEDATPLEGDALERECARLRKRFERLKAELKRLAAEDGLLK